MARKRWSIFKIKESEPDVLQQRIDKTLENFPILRGIYDDSFVQKLIKKKFDLDNTLLWNLASKQPKALATLRKMEYGLKILEDEDGPEKFKSKLKQYDTVSFTSALLEIDFASHYKAKYSIEIEPTIPGTKKGPDLRVESKDGPVFFEIKNVLTEKDKKLRRFESLVMDKIGIIEEKFVFSIHMLTEPDMSIVDPLKKYLNRKLTELDERGIDEIQIKFPEDNPILKVNVQGRPNKLDHGYLASFSWGGGRDDVKNIRKKIESKLKQLPKGEMNVVVIEPLDSFVESDDFINAVIGNEIITWKIPTQDSSKCDIDPEITAKRGRDRIFNPHKNTRISAVCAYWKTFEDGKWNNFKFILHNPFAEKSIPAEFFSEPNIKQFIKDETKSTEECIEFIIQGSGDS